MENNKISIDLSKLVKDDAQIKVSFDNFLNDKINREFLSNHVGEQLVLWGYFDAIDDKTNALMQECCYNENDTNFSLGHMWWSDFSSHIPVGKTFEQGELVRILGKVYKYDNNDHTYTIGQTYGVSVVAIL